MDSITYFEIHSSLPQREIAFYEKVFGWKFKKENNSPLEYYRIESSTILGGLLKRPYPAPQVGSSTNAFICSMEVRNFDETSQLILHHGGSISLPKFAIPGKCWQGYFYDEDNNSFGIFEVDEKAM